MISLDFGKDGARACRLRSACRKGRCRRCPPRSGSLACRHRTCSGIFHKRRAGFGAPPMTFEVNGKQYLAIASGASPTSRTKLLASPELKEQSNATVLYVFGL
jgi:hypothetical protein